MELLNSDKVISPDHLNPSPTNSNTTSSVACENNQDEFTSGHLSDTVLIKRIQRLEQICEKILAYDEGMKAMQDKLLDMDSRIKKLEDKKVSNDNED